MGDVRGRRQEEMNIPIRFILCAVIAVGYYAYRQGDVSLPLPSPVVPVSGLQSTVNKMSSQERKAMAEFYSILSKSIAADPESEPVFTTKGAFRKAHRAGLLMLWKGLLDNEPGKYPTLREELEQFLADEIGLADTPMNQEDKQQVSNSLSKLSGIFRG